MQLTSSKNPYLQKLRRAIHAGRATEEGHIAVEGPHLLEEALQGHWPVARIVTTSGGRLRYGKLLAKINAEIVEAKIIEVSARAFAALSATEHAQELLAMLQPPSWSWEKLIGHGFPLVILDGIQDPGNAGTIVRSAEAFGAGGVVFTEGCVHIANGKLLRATAGSLFRLPFLEGVSRRQLIHHARNSGVKLYALVAQGHTDLQETVLGKRCGLIVGGEGGGVSTELLAASETLFIRTTGVESLNAAVACSIALFQLAGQRQAMGKA